MEYFSGVIGQEKAVVFLHKCIESGNISHAYLFQGPEGVGKMLTARAFAQALISNFDEGAGVYFQEGLHPDLLVLEVAEGKTRLSKEQIQKQMQSWLALKPYRASNRVVIIRDAHLMSIEAENALLKTLEEPPSYAIIILVADENNLLETIISRCQSVRFLPIPETRIEGYLLQQGIGAGRAYRAARLGRESLAAALRYAEQEDFSALWDIAVEGVNHLSSPGILSVFSTAERMEGAADLVSGMMAMILRDLCIYKETGRDDLLVIPESRDMVACTERLNPLKSREAIQSIFMLQRNYSRNVKPLLNSINIAYQVKNAFNN